jgi:hypothetical protein
VPLGTSVDVESEARVVWLTRRQLECFALFTDLFPDVPCRDTGSMELEPVIFVPGLGYVVNLDYDFGGRCGGGQLLCYVDLPLLGIHRVAATWLWIS